MEDKQMEEVEQKLEAEVAPALVAVHPDQEFVSVSVGSDIRVFNLRNGCGVTLVDEGGGHKDSVRAIRFSRSGRLFVSVGDDKLLKVWDTQNWRCAYSVISEKRLTSVAISIDERFVCFADKFGVVYAVDVGDYSGGSPAPVNKKGVPILSHYCSIITRLEFSPDGRYIVTADRDFKIRVTVFPKKSLDGAHEIQSFCLGHTEFVSCIAFVSCPNNSQGLLVSGSGDSTVRLWEYASGSLLSTCEVGAKAGLLSSNNGQDEVLPAVTDLCATSDGSLIAVAIQSFPGIMLLSCDQSAKILSVYKMVSVKEEAFIPTSLGASCSASFLWMAMGASTSPGTDSTLVARLRVVSGFCINVSESSDEPEPVVLDDSEVPKGEGLLVALQGKLSIGEEAFSTAADAVKTAMRNLMIKKQYSAERREERKRGRNDKKNQIPACS